MTHPIEEAWRELRAMRAEPLATSPSAAGIQPTDNHDRSSNPFRPQTLADVVGQQPAKRLMRAAIDTTRERGEPLPHTLLVGPSGTGKTTFSHVIANELDAAIYEVEAPVTYDTLVELRGTMRDRDVLKVEEIHQQGIMERRGRSTAMQPEVLYGVMEDRVMATQRGPVPFPHITIIGTTTDEGLLPDAFINRFALRPRLERYTRDELRAIAASNAATLGLEVTDDGLDVVTDASRGVPRHIGNLVVNANLIGKLLDGAVAREVLSLNGITGDGLTSDMQAMLTFLYTHAARRTSDGDVRYQASVNTIATAIGKSRDSKAIALRVEPYLIELGLVQVTHGGRQLTDAGVRRAQELIA